MNTDHSNYGGAHIQLTADIDLSGYAEGLISQASDPAYVAAHRPGLRYRGKKAPPTAACSTARAM